MRTFIVLVAMLTALVLGTFSPAFQHQPRAFAQTSPAAARDKYMGTAPCSVDDCHGSVVPKEPAEDIRIHRNEYYTWLKRDKHARAYEVLLKERSLRIAQNLKLLTGPEQSERCLSCHAIQAPSHRRGKYFKVTEGVSCEACHGASQQWLRPHQKEGYEKAQELGMTDMRNLLTRAEVCLSCHVGNAEKNIDHALIAAGHPDLIFELDTFTALMPPHWHRDQGEWAGLRAWSLGQATTLRAIAQRLAYRAQQHADLGWPEFSEFDCFSCHHTVENIVSSYYQQSGDGLRPAEVEWSPSWRQARGYEQTPGLPLWKLSSSLLFRQLIGILAQEALVELEQALTALASHMAKMTTANPQAIKTAATRVSQVVDQLIARIVDAQIDARLLLTLLQKISAENENIAHAGFRSAEQAVMALDTLFLEYQGKTNPPQKEGIRAAIQNLFPLVATPHGYDPEAFSKGLQVVQESLPH